MKRCVRISPIAAGILCAVLVQLALSVSIALGQGEVVGWGKNDAGQCSAPPPNVDFIMVAAGTEHSLGIKVDGSVIAWGKNDYGQCNVPLPNADFVAVAAGDRHSLGLKSDGTVVGWGEDAAGQCSVPSPNEDFIAVAAGWRHSLGLKSDGTIVAWGHDAWGQCAVPSPNSDFVAVSAGWTHSMGLKNGGVIVAWGNNHDGQCTVPSSNSGFIAIAGGYEHSMGLRGDGSIEVWGLNYNGVCTVPPPNTGFIRIAAGYRHNLGFKDNGSIVAWGGEGWGETDVPSPNSYFTAMAAGYGYGLAIRSDPSVPVYLSRFTARRHDGTVTVSWSVSTADVRSDFHVWREGVGAARVRLSQMPLGDRDVYEFVDSSPLAGAANYWLQELRGDGAECWYGPVSLEAPPAPNALRLHQNTPNPFNPLTTLRFDVPVVGRVRLEVYDVAGRLIRTLLDVDLPAGSHQAIWDGKDERGLGVASGNYFARLSVGGKPQAVHMSLVR